MWVSDISIDGTEFHPGEAISAQALVHWDLLDLGNFHVASYYRKKNAQYWTRITSFTGTLEMNQNPHWVSIPDFPVPSQVGEYEFGALDQGNLETYGTAEAVFKKHGAYRSFSVTPEPTPGMGQLSIYTFPEGATIYLNGESLGEGNIIGLDVSPGIYEIKATKFGYKDETKRVTVAEGSVVPVEIVLTSSFSLEELSKYAPWIIGGVLVGTVVIVAASPKMRNKIKSYFTE